jgi:hypothetical protein
MQAGTTEAGGEERGDIQAPVRLRVIRVGYSQEHGRICPGDMHGDIIGRGKGGEWLLPQEGERSIDVSMGYSRRGRYYLGFEFAMSRLFWRLL